VQAAFRRYRVMSFVTGTTLLSLCVTQGLNWWDLSLWKSIKPLVVIDGVAHGTILYPIYLILSFQLVLKARLPLWYLAIMFLAGFVPGVAFLVEWWLARQLYPQGLPWKVAATAAGPSTSSG
jgi:integral membrane protein